MRRLIIGFILITTLTNVVFSHEKKEFVKESVEEVRNPHKAHGSGDTLSEKKLQHLPSGKDLDELLQKCKALPHSYDKIACLKPYFHALAYQQSAKFAVAQAEELKKQGIIEECHLPAHFVGEVNVIKHKFDIGTSLSSCPINCIQGCIHGVMQTYISRKIDPPDLASELKQVCDSVVGDTLKRRQCVHGVGHGFLTGRFLSIDEAIRSCNHFKDDEGRVCLGGLFMENMQQYLLWPEDKLTNQLPNICADATTMNDKNLTHICIDAIGEGLMFYTGHQLEESLKFCDLLPDAHHDVCKRAAIVEAQSSPATFDITSCDVVPKKYKNLCKQMGEARE